MTLLKSKYLLGLLFLTLISCKDEVLLPNEINTEMLFGLWVRQDIETVTYIENTWIPTNLHIGKAAELNKVRVRILDQIACTDSYPEKINNTVTFSQYGLVINVSFENSEEGTITITKNQSKVISKIKKTTREPYWGVCF